MIQEYQLRVLPEVATIEGVPRTGKRIECTGHQRNTNPETQY